MSTDFTWALLGLAILFGWIVYGLVQEQLEARNRMRLREMLHRERMAALEKGKEMPDTDADDILQQSFAAGERPGDPAASLRALRRSALGAGLVLLLGGIGWWIALAGVPATRETLGMQEMASLGVIPAMVGLGLLIFWVVLGRERN